MLQSSADAQSSTLQRIQSYFSSTGGGDIATALSGLSASLSQLSANPSSPAAQQAVLSAAGNLANAFKNTASGLSSAQTDANVQVTQTVAQINSLTS